MYQTPLKESFWLQISRSHSFGSPNGTCYLNPMRHNGASIKNTYCH